MTHLWCDQFLVLLSEKVAMFRVFSFSFWASLHIFEDSNLYACRFLSRSCWTPTQSFSHNSTSWVPIEENLKLLEIQLSNLQLFCSTQKDQRSGLSLNLSNKTGTLSRNSFQACLIDLYCSFCIFLLRSLIRVKSNSVENRLTGLHFLCWWLRHQEPIRSWNSAINTEQLSETCNLLL